MVSQNVLILSTMGKNVILVYSFSKGNGINVELVPQLADPRTLLLMLLTPFKANSIVLSQKSKKIFSPF